MGIHLVVFVWLVTSRVGNDVCDNGKSCRCRIRLALRRIVKKSTDKYSLGTSRLSLPIFKMVENGGMATLHTTTVSKIESEFLLGIYLC